MWTSVEILWVVVVSALWDFVGVVALRHGLVERQTRWTGLMETQIHVTLVKHAAVFRVAVQTVRLVLAKGIGARTCKHQNII